MGNYILSVVVMVLLAGPNLWAQEETAETTTKAEEVKEEVKAEQPKEESSPSEAGVEKIEVTGSYIRRTDVEGPSPIVVIDRAQIEASGVNSVGAVLQQSTASAFGADSNRVNLKGLGSAKTLILINGQRAPAGGSSFGSGPVNTNFIPLAAVERIEILNDGASATYGSDALAGVVNIITRKNIDGVAFINQYNMTTNNGGDTNRLSLAYGNQEADSNFLTSLQVTYNQGSRLSDLDFSGLVNNVDARRSTNYFGNDGAPRPSPLCNQLDQSGLCVDYDQSRFRFNDGYDIDSVTQYNRKVGSNTEFYSTLLLGYGMSEQESPIILQEPGVGIGANFTAAETPAAWATLPGYDGTVDTKVFHRFDDFVNTRRSEDYYVGLVTGLKGYYGDSDWEWDFTLNNQFNTSTTSEQNVGVFPAVKAAFSSGAYNPFDLGARDTTGLGVDTFNRNRFQVNWAEFKTNGELGSFLGFDWASAFGTSAAHFAYGDNRADVFVDGQAIGQSGVVGSAGRELYALFAEFSGLLGKSFEVSFSLRGDAYSDFGETFNPK
ncbi:MAG: TonB-dependent receptor plug domain-containing protein, partial [Bdellovibrionales bacterium]|nr:TonB-dependent receptor plug domain-containing protein [Bdellovibrionales bacterium]